MDFSKYLHHQTVLLRSRAARLEREAEELAAQAELKRSEASLFRDYAVRLGAMSDQAQGQAEQTAGHNFEEQTQTIRDQVHAQAAAAEMAEAIDNQTITIEQVALHYETYRRTGTAEEQLRAVDALRKEFDSASKEKRAGRGRMEYVLDRAREMDAQMTAADAELDKPIEYVYLAEHELDGDQKLFALGQDANGRYAISLDNLTEAQSLALASGELTGTGRNYQMKAEPVASVPHHGV
jgi:hypothetical protein